MFFYVVGTHTKCIINDFSPAPRTNIWIFKCHTVTHGTDLRKSPLVVTRPLLVTAVDKWLIVIFIPAKVNCCACRLANFWTCVRTETADQDGVSEHGFFEGDTPSQLWKCWWQKWDPQ